MDLVGPADGFRASLRKTEEANLALLDEACHAADGVLDGHTWIHTVLVVEVDHVDAEALQARLARLDDVVRPAVHAVGPALALNLSELCRQHDAVAPAAKGAAQHFFVMASTIHIGGVEVVDALVDRIADEILGPAVVGGAVHSRKRHAAEPDDTDRRALRTE